MPAKRATKADLPSDETLTADQASLASPNGNDSDRAQHHRSAATSQANERQKGLPAASPLVDEFRSGLAFPLDPFQEEAIRILDAGRSVMVAAPTGTGKTVVAEFAIYLAYQQGLRSIYTAPIKALSNQKFRDLRNQYGDAVGLLTGDIVENPRGQILVMTTEVLRNMLVQRPRVLDDVGCVVFDEIHYLADPERGTAWEESIILAPSHVQLVCLSATVSNAQELADWISAVHRPIDLVFHDERAVPLEQYYFFQHKLHRVIDAQGRLVTNFEGIGGENRRRQAARRGGRRQAGRSAPGGRTDELLRETDPADVVHALQQAGLLPAIYFVFSRKDTERVAEELSVNSLVDNRQRRAIVERAEEYLSKLEPVDRGLEQVQNLERVLRSGIAYHHAGLLPILKVLVEDLFAQGLLPVVVATDTLALGVNLPAKTVVIGEMTKFDGESRRLLTPNEYQQMTGRAGRRGLDRRGTAVIPYSPWVGFDEAIGVAQGELHPVRSGFAIRYNTLLNLWNYYGEDQIVSLFSNSLREFQIDAHLRALQHELQEIDAEIAALEVGCGHVPAEIVQQYEYDRKALHEARKDLRRAEDHVQRVLRRIAETPFGLDRSEIKRRLRTAEPGTMVFLRSGDWGVLLRPGPFLNGVVGLFLIGHQAAELKTYGEILDIPQGSRRITLPPPLEAMEGPVEDVRPLLSRGQWSALRKRIVQAEMPEIEEEWAQQRQAIDEAYSSELNAAHHSVTEARERIATLQQRIESNHVHTCPQRKQHEQRLHRRRELEFDRRQVAKELNAVLEEKHTRTREIVANLVGVLIALGYIRRGQLSAKAQVLKDIFAPNGLIICEAIERGLFDQLNAAELVEVISWFAYDRDIAFANRLDLPKRVWNARQQLDRLQQQIFRIEGDYHVYLSTGASPYFFGVAYGWCRGWTFEQLLDAVNLTEGDIVMTLNKTLDLMRQIRQALRSSDHGPVLIPKLEEGEQLIRRGIVEQCFTALSPTGRYAPVEEEGIDEVPIHEPPAPTPPPPATGARRRTRRKRAS